MISSGDSTMTMTARTMDKSQLLDALKIDRQAPELRSRTPWLWVAVGVVVLLLGVIVWLLVARGEEEAEKAELAVSAPATAEPAAPSTVAPTAILQATGYVTARRQA